MLGLGKYALIPPTTDVLQIILDNGYSITAQGMIPILILNFML